jgi:hypothetical protein
MWQAQILKQNTILSFMLIFTRKSCKKLNNQTGQNTQFSRILRTLQIEGGHVKDMHSYDIALVAGPKNFVRTTQSPRGVICQTFQVKLILP